MTMNDMHRYFVMGAFIALLITFLFVLLRTVSRKSDFVGKVTGGYISFIIGKIGVYGTWTMFILKAIFPDLGFFVVPAFISWIATALLITATIVFIVSFTQLNEAAKMGIPEENTKLKTKGIYSFSRNPLYLAVFTICISSVIYFPDIFNLILAIAGIIVHHRMALEEEKFLGQRFGTEWLNCKQKVRRYL